MHIWEFWYMCLECNTSNELADFIKNNKWYFKKLKPEAQEYLRGLYRNYKNREELLYK